MPHFNVIGNYYDKEMIDKMERILPKDTQVVGIDEDTAYIKNGSKWAVMGIGKIHEPIKSII